MERLRDHNLGRGKHPPQLRMRARQHVPGGGLDQSQRRALRDDFRRWYVLLLRNRRSRFTTSGAESVLYSFGTPSGLSPNGEHRAAPLTNVNGVLWDDSGGWHRQLWREWDRLQDHDIGRGERPLPRSMKSAIFVTVSSKESVSDFTSIMTSGLMGQNPAASVAVRASIRG